MKNEMNYYELAVAKFGVSYVEDWCDYVGVGVGDFEFDAECYADCAADFVNGVD